MKVVNVVVMCSNERAVARTTHGTIIISSHRMLINRIVFHGIHSLCT